MSCLQVALPHGPAGARAVPAARRLRGRSTSVATARPFLPASSFVFLDARGSERWRWYLCFESVERWPVLSGGK